MPTSREFVGMFDDLKPTADPRWPLLLWLRAAYCRAKLIHQMIHGSHTYERACCPRRRMHCRCHLSKEKKNVYQQLVVITCLFSGRAWSCKQNNANLRLNDIKIISIVALFDDHILRFRFLLKHGIKNFIHLFPVVGLSEWTRRDETRTSRREKIT